MNKKRKVLFVDNDKNVLKSIKRQFHSISDEWDVSFTDSGKTALEMLKEKSFDVVISDLKISEMDGIDFLKFVRDTAPKTLRIALTGHSTSNITMDSVNIIHQYLQKPCELATIKNVIIQAQNLQELLGNENLTEIISRIKSLPSLPSIYTEIINKVDLPNTSLRDIGKIVAKDIGMSTKFLQLINSSFFGLPQKITTPVDAVVMLGIETVKTLVLSVGIFQKLGNNIDKKFAESLWAHSNRIASYCKNLAIYEEVPRKIQDDYFAAGMFHDLGKLVFLSEFPEDYKKVLELTKKENISLCKAEKKIFGADHTAVGAYLMQIWGLPGLIVYPCAFHHSIEKFPQARFNPTLAVHFADYMDYKIRNKEEDISSKLNIELLKESDFYDFIPEWEEVCRDVNFNE